MYTLQFTTFFSEKNQQSKKVKSVDPVENKVLYTSFLVFAYLLQVYICGHIGVNIIVYKYFQPFVYFFTSCFSKQLFLGLQCNLDH